MLLTASAHAQDSLLTYMAAAVEANPKVQAAWQSYQSAAQAVCQAGTLSDPELTVGWYPKPMQLVNGEQIATFGIMQMFPWFGSMKAAREEKDWQTRSMYENYRAVGIDVAFAVEQKWYEILTTQEQMRAIEQNIAYLKQIKETAIYQYKTAQAGMKKGNLSDQLRLESEALGLQEQLETAQTRLTLQRQQLNLLMHRDVHSPVVLPDSIVLRQMPLVDFSDIEQASPELAAIRDEQSSLQSTVEKNRKSGMPKIGLGAQYMLNGEVDAPRMADMNGNDMWMAQLKLTLPIYRRKTNSAVRQAQLQQNAAQERYAGVKDDLQSEWLSILQHADEQQRSIRLLTQQLDLLDRTLALMQTEYAVAATSLTDLLDTDRQRVSLSLRMAEAKARYNTTVAEMERLAALYAPNSNEK